MPSSSFPDWVGVASSPSADHLALVDLDDVPTTISSFADHIDDALGSPCDMMASLYCACRLDPVIGWQSVLISTLPKFPPPRTHQRSLADHPRVQLASHYRFRLNACPPFLPFLFAGVQAAPAWRRSGGRPAVALPPWSSMIPHPLFDLFATPLERGCHDNNYNYSQGRCSPGQQLSQHSSVLRALLHRAS